MDTALGQLLPTASADAALAQLLTESAAAPKSQGTRKVEKKVVTAPVAVAEKEVAPAAAATKAGGLTLSQQAEEGEQQEGQVHVAVPHQLSARVCACGSSGRTDRLTVGLMRR